MATAAHDAGTDSRALMHEELSRRLLNPDRTSLRSHYRPRLSSFERPLAEQPLCTSKLLDNGVAVGVSVVGLTVKERILLHLFDFVRFASEADVPQEVTQSGIAAAVRVPAQHASQYVRPLVADGLVEEAVRHVRRGVRRKKAYFLTARGRSKVVTLREAMFQESVPVRGLGGEVRTIPLARVYHEERRGTSLPVLLHELESAQVISIAPVRPPASLVDFSGEAPSPSLFYGREKELGQIRDSLGRVPLVAITGITGIGKTTLASRVCEEERGRKSLFWRRIRRWDTARDLAFRVANFLKSMGRDGLHEYLSSPEANELNRVEEILLSELGGANALFVFDDIHYASPDALAFLSLMCGVLRTIRESTAILVSRTVPSLYNRRDVVVDGTVIEVTLQGLDASESRRLLEDAGVAPELVSGFVKASRGSPLFLRIMSRAGSTFAKAWNTIATYITEEVEPTLEEGERECLEIASLYEVPVPAEALLVGGGAGVRTLVSLQRKGLLIELGTGMFLVHDLLRSYFRKGLERERSVVLTKKIVDWLVEEAETRQRTERPHDGIALLENAVRIEVDPRRRLSALKRLAEVRGHMGDFLGCIEARRIALNETTEPMAKATLHRGIASGLRNLWRIEEAEEEIEKGLALVPSGPSVETACLLLERAITTGGPRAWHDLATLRDWIPQLPQDPLLAARVAYWEGQMYVSDLAPPDWVRGEACFREALEREDPARDIGLSEGCRRMLACADLLKGNVGEAVSKIDQAIEIGRRTGTNGYSLALTIKARILAEFIGNLEEPESLYLEAYRLFRSSHQRLRLLWLQRHFADLYRWQGLLERALESLNYFLSAGKDTLSAEAQVENLALASRIETQRGELVTAQGYLGRAVEAAADLPHGATSFYVEWARGALLAARGDKQAAEHHFHQALIAGSPPRRGFVMQEVLASGGVRAEVLLDLGRLLANAGRADHAGEVYQQALVEAQKDGRQPLVEAAASALGRLKHAS